MYAGHDCGVYAGHDCGVYVPAGHDCGVYALYFVEAMCKVKLLGEPAADVLQSITRDSVKKWRTDTKHLISVIGK